MVEVPARACDSQPDRIIQRPGEAHMASKDKGGKAAKTSASKTLKEKRADKAEKKDAKRSSSEHRGS